MKPLKSLLLATTLLASQLQATPNHCFLEDTTLSGSIAYESAFVYRGSHLAQDIINPKLQLNTPIYTHCEHAFSTHIGAWGVFTYKNSENIGAEQINPYAAISYTWDDFITTEFGYTRYTFTHSDLNNRNFRNHNTSRQDEIFLTLSAQLCFHPSLKLFYNFSLNQFIIEPSIAFFFDLTNRLTLSFDLLGGFLHANAFNGNQRPDSIPHDSNNYFYTRAKADLTFHINDCISLSAGPRYAINSDRKHPQHLPYGPYSANALDCDNDTFWLGASLNFGF